MRKLKNQNLKGNRKLNLKNKFLKRKNKKNLNKISIVCSSYMKKKIRKKINCIHSKRKLLVRLIQRKMMIIFNKSQFLIHHRKKMTFMNKFGKKVILKKPKRLKKKPDKKNWLKKLLNLKNKLLS